MRGAEGETKSLKERLSSQNTTPSNLPFRNEGERKTIQNNQKLKEFVTTQPALQMTLKEELHSETAKDNQHHERISS